MRNLTQVGLLYGNRINASTQFKTSFNLEFGSNRHLNWNTGINLKYLGFVVGGSYGSDSGRKNYHTAGAGYSIDRFKVFLNHMRSESNTNVGFTRNVLRLQYKVKKGIIPYCEVGRLSLKEFSIKIPSKAIICGIKILDQ